MKEKIERTRRKRIEDLAEKIGSAAPRTELSRKHAPKHLQCDRCGKTCTSLWLLPWNDKETLKSTKEVGLRRSNSTPLAKGNSARARATAAQIQNSLSRHSSIQKHASIRVRYVCAIPNTKAWYRTTNAVISEEDAIIKDMRRMARIGTFALMSIDNCLELDEPNTNTATDDSKTWQKEKEERKRQQRERRRKGEERGRQLEKRTRQ